MMQIDPFGKIILKGNRYITVIELGTHHQIKQYIV